MHRAQDNYKFELALHPAELSDQAKVLFEAKKGAASFIAISDEVIMKVEKISELEEESELEEPWAKEATHGESDADKNNSSASFIVFGASEKRVPLGDCSNAPSLTAEEQLQQAKERVALEKATADQQAKEKAKAAEAQAKAKEKVAEAQAEQLVAVEQKKAIEALEAHVDLLWRAKAVFASSVPKTALPPFDVENTSAPIGIVLIPAKKYPAFAKKEADGRADFMGWAGKLSGFEMNKKKIKVKVFGDAGFEHIAINGSSVYALANLTRLA